MKILVADDEEASREQIGSTIKVWGYEPVNACNGDDAIRIMTGEDPPLLGILNWKLSGTSAADVCREIRLTRLYPYTYLIALIAKGDKDDPLECLEAGADEWLRRPVPPHELRGRLRVANRVLAAQQKLLTVCSEAQFQATRDPVTGLWNRASILKFADQYLSRCSKADEPLFLVLLKVNGLDEINRRFGSTTGDNVLREAAERLRAMIPTYDHIGRYFGVKFLFIEPNSPRQRVESLLGELERTIAGKDFMVPGGTAKLNARATLVETEQRYEGLKSLLLRLDRSLAEPAEGPEKASQPASEAAGVLPLPPRKNIMPNGIGRHP